MLSTYKGKWVGVLTLSLFCSGLVFGLLRFFPEADRWSEDWQLRTFKPVHIHDSLALISIRQDSPLLCENGMANPEKLAVVLRSLSRVGAKIIAPALAVEFPASSDCGGLTGVVRLADVSQQAGSIIYPENAPTIIKGVALGHGTISLQTDPDGVFRGFMTNGLPSDRPALSFSEAIANSIPRANNPGQIPVFDYQRRLLRGLGTSPFHSYSAEKILSSIEQQEWDRLTRWFKEKIVILIPENPELAGISTPWASFLSPEMVHVWQVNGVLTNSWAVQPQRLLVFLITSLLGAMLGNSLLNHSSTRRKVFYVLNGLFLCGLVIMFGLQEGWLFPLVSMGMSLGLALMSVMVWRSWSNQEFIGKRILEGERELSTLRQELIGKQNLVQLLEERVLTARKQAWESNSVIEHLHESQQTLSDQLSESQSAMATTQKQIGHLERELEILRAQVPVPSVRKSQGPECNELLDPFQECESFQILTRDPHMLRVFQDLKKAAATAHPLLLTGETGTGKEVFAQAAHHLSPRRQNPFISVNMAAIHSELFEGELFGDVKGAFTGAVGRRGYVESADGGTLFLDEVGELSPPMQAKLLRVLETGTFYRVGDSRLTRVDVRIIAATNRDLQAEVGTGRYREDLYYRLKSIVICLPSLRKRSSEDRALLAQKFLEEFTDSRYSEMVRFSQGALDAINHYPWPGNIRELRQTIAQAVTLVEGSLITEADLQLRNHKKSLEGRPKEQPRAMSESLEDTMVLDCLRQNKFDMQATAKMLGWDRSTVTQRLKGLGFQSLVENQGNVERAARSLAGDPQLVLVVEKRLREYAKNLCGQPYASYEEALQDCRKRFRNLPERFFPAVERLLRQEFPFPLS